MICSITQSETIELCQILCAVTVRFLFASCSAYLAQRAQQQVLALRLLAQFREDEREVFGQVADRDIAYSNAPSKQ